ncbi:hypothetical protein GXW82_25270 [Streptacidiphilus sp. 4-A2]|nr:hypothetical protein [Streptacidiphilus sp. 4-A2]
MTAIAGRPRQVVRRVRELLADAVSASPARGLLVGVAYKPGVADLRESPALEILEELREDGAKVHFTDPLVPAVRIGAEVLVSESARSTGTGTWCWCTPSTGATWTGSPVWERQPGIVLDATYRLDSSGEGDPVTTAYGSEPQYGQPKSDDSYSRREPPAGAPYHSDQPYQPYQSGQQYPSDSRTVIRDLQSRSVPAPSAHRPGAAAGGLGRVGPLARGR